jgi:hypothetical protein
MNRLTAIARYASYLCVLSFMLYLLMIGLYVRFGAAPDAAFDAAVHVVAIVVPFKIVTDFVNMLPRGNDHA